MTQSPPGKFFCAKGGTHPEKQLDKYFFVFQIWISRTLSRTGFAIPSGLGFLLKLQTFNFLLSTLFTFTMRQKYESNDSCRRFRHTTSSFY